MIVRIVSVILLLSSIGHSKTLIVSDIDDTIKVSHIRDKMDMAWYAFVTTSEFKGMSELYTSLLEQNAESSIIYVTNANEVLMGRSHRNFLAGNEFPQGQIFFKKPSDDDHKYNTIKHYLETNEIEKLILIGDNGEHDIAFYARIQQEFSDRIFIKTYIRILYSETLPIEQYQMGFVTPLEILADFRVNDFISIEKYKTLSEQIAGEISHEILSSEKPSKKAPQYFPEWLECRGYEINLEGPITSPIILEAVARVDSLCN